MGRRHTWLRHGPARPPRPVASALVAALLAIVLGTTLAACGAAGPAEQSPAPAPTAAVSASLGDGPPVTASAPAPSASSGPAAPTASTTGGPASGASLNGRTIVIDPGHNGANWRNPGAIGRKVDIGNGTKACDTTGAETNTGYTESAFTLDVSLRVAALLRARGATVVLTRSDDRGVGPCISERAAIGNRAHADAAISIHGDGAPEAGHGFHVIVPRGIGSNDAIVAPSRRLGVSVRDAFRAGTGQALSTYTGTTTEGLVARDDLGGLNLSTVPKVFIECGNMRNAADAHRMTSATWRQQAARALADGLAGFVLAPS